MRKALVGKLGENVAIRRFARISASGILANYIHGGAKIGVLLDISGGDDALAKDLAMHIAACKPVSLAKEQVPADLIRKERDIATAKAAESGKPANIVENMIEGAVQKFLKEVTLLGQLHAPHGCRWGRVKNGRLISTLGRRRRAARQSVRGHTPGQRPQTRWRLYYRYNVTISVVSVALRPASCRGRRCSRFASWR
jgi:hypothetical protein